MGVAPSRAGRASLSQLPILFPISASPWALRQKDPISRSLEILFRNIFCTALNVKLSSSPIAYSGGSGQHIELSHPSIVDAAPGTQKSVSEVRRSELGRMKLVVGAAGLRIPPAAVTCDHSSRNLECNMGRQSLQVQQNRPFVTAITGRSNQVAHAFLLTILALLSLSLSSRPR